MDRTVIAHDGRTLAVQIAGDPEGKPVLVHMGTPNSRHLYGPNVADAERRGLKLICHDRPGYGGSTPHPGRKVADCADDVRAICETLDLDRIAVWGISGGGPCSIACAALLPDLVVAAASLAAPAPYGAEGLDFFGGMGQGNVDDMQLMVDDRVAARSKLEKDREEFMALSAGEVKDQLQSLLCPADSELLDGPMGEYLAYISKEGLAPGPEGWWDDSVSHMSRWGFELADVSVPMLLLHGEQDRFVPFSHGRWLAEHIPGVEARLTSEDGHLTLLERRVAEVHSWLSERL